MADFDFDYIPRELRQRGYLIDECWLLDDERAGDLAVVGRIPIRGPNSTSRVLQFCVNPVAHEIGSPTDWSVDLGPEIRVEARVGREIVTLASPQGIQARTVFRDVEERLDYSIDYADWIAEVREIAGGKTVSYAYSQFLGFSGDIHGGHEEQCAVAARDFWGADSRSVDADWCHLATFDLLGRGLETVEGAVFFYLTEGDLNSRNFDRSIAFYSCL